MIDLSDDVRSAIEAGSPIVALESTVLTHGLPRPRNLEVGLAMEDAVRAAGATPATVAVIDGVPVVGVTRERLGRLASTTDALKISTRDLPLAAATGADGGTTVAATLFLAARCGIRVFATGGIGGVHRGDAHDVSADLGELARTPMLVVCAGAKSILDLAATREALETAGVLLLGWRTDELPAFYARESGLAVDARVDTAAEAAAVMREHRRLGLPGAVLLCVPPPPEAALDAAEVERAVTGAVERARRRGVGGRRLTPLLLTAVAEATGGRSLEANVALLLRNARVAAEVAVAATEAGG
jgi:pseudouridylate synthase